MAKISLNNGKDFLSFTETKKYVKHYAKIWERPEAEEDWIRDILISGAGRTTGLSLPATWDNVKRIMATAENNFIVKIS